MHKEVFLNKLGRHIVSIRKSKGLTQTELANRCFKDRQSIERVENGKTNPTSYYLFELSKALDVNLKDLLDF